ncbi:hypothetical protein [Nisaea sp.]|uniref:hypothetical protein n=1 Tax=Nisaea sp. TaxID=2024842 RepID=UPI002B272307|nr:hypothetical protein [Nisaea sp.]
MSVKTIICTAGEDRFFPISQCLLRSVRDQQQGDIDIGYLNLGLSAGNLEKLSEYGASVVTPGWDIDFVPPDGDPTKVGDGFKAMTSRPFLRDHFPGYDVYIWIDADAWVQNWWAIDWLIEGARRGDLNIAPEMDRAYEHCFDFKAYVRWTVDQQAQFFGHDVAKRVGYNPVLNCGVFSMPSAHPLWDLWAEKLRDALQRHVGFFADQMSLNHVVYAGDHPRCFLPSQFNWLASMALPAFDPGISQFVEPGIPHRPLGILHLSGKTKSKPQSIDVLGRSEQVKTWLLYDPQRNGTGVS